MIFQLKRIISYNNISLLSKQYYYYKYKSLKYRRHVKCKKKKYADFNCFQLMRL